MLDGDGGTITLGGLPAGRIASWTMRPAGEGLTIDADARIGAYWARACADPDLRATLRMTLTRSANPDYRLTFAGTATVTTTRIVLHRAMECST